VDDLQRLVVRRDGALTHALGPRCDWLTIALVRAVFMFVASATLARAAGARLVVWRPRTL